jgi:hypothetical protein
MASVPDHRVHGRPFRRFSDVVGRRKGSFSCHPSPAEQIDF